MLLIRVYTCMGRLETTVQSTRNATIVGGALSLPAIYEESRPFTGDYPVQEISRALATALQLIDSGDESVLEHTEA